MIRRILPALAVLFGRKTAMDNEVPRIIQSTAYAIASAIQHQRHYLTEMDTPSEPTLTEQHSTAVGQIRRTQTYLRSLPALFVGIAALLEAARVQAQIGSAERKAFQDKIDELTANKDQLEDLIGETAGLADQADTSDNSLQAETTPPPVNTPTTDPATGLPILPEGQEAAPNPPVSAVTGETTTPVGAVVGSDNPDPTPGQLEAATDLSGPPADSDNPTPSTGAGTPVHNEPAAETLSTADGVPDGVQAPDESDEIASAEGTGPAKDGEDEVAQA